MYKLLKYGVTFSLLFIIASCSSDNDPWQKYTSKEGGYSVEMPATAKKTEKKEVTAFGKQTTYFLTWKPSSFDIDKFKLFQVSYSDCPSRVSSDSLFLNTMLDSAISMRKKEFAEGDIESQVVDINGHQGRAFFYDVPKGTSIVTVKECIINNKLYDLTVISKKNYSTNTEINNFFNSFQVYR